MLDLIKFRKHAKEKQLNVMRITSLEKERVAIEGELQAYREKLQDIGEATRPEKIDIFQVDENGMLVCDNFKIFFETWGMTLNVGRVAIDFSRAPLAEFEDGFNHPFQSSNEGMKSVCLGRGSTDFVYLFDKQEFNSAFEILKATLSFVALASSPYRRPESDRNMQSFLHLKNPTKFLLCDGCCYHDCQCPRCGFCGGRGCICDVSRLCASCHGLHTQAECKEYKKQGLLKLSKLRGYKNAESK